MAFFLKRSVFTVLGRPVNEHFHCITCGCRFPRSKCSNWDKDPVLRHKGCLLYQGDPSRDRHLCPHCFKLNAKESREEDARLEQEQIRSLMSDVEVEPGDDPSSYLQRLADRQLLYVIRHRNRSFGTHLLVVATPEGFQNTIRTYLRGNEVSDEFFRKEADGKGCLKIWIAADSKISEIIPIDVEEGKDVDIIINIRPEHVNDINDC